MDLYISDIAVTVTSEVSHGVAHRCTVKELIWEFFKVQKMDVFLWVVRIFFTVVTRANTSLYVKHITKSVSKYEIVRITYMRFYKLNSN